MIKNILNSIEDFRDCINNETIKVCLLHPYSKVSIKGWSGFVEPGELLLKENEENNLGISLIGAEYPGEPILTCIDIDGDKREIKGIDVEQFSKDWMFQIITQKFEQLGINYMAIQSSSGGYHIYIYCRTESSRYGATRDLNYPKNSDAASTNQDISMFLSGHYLFAQELYNTEFPKNCVEIWCNKRYMVAPGSLIEDKDKNYTSEVKLLPNGVQKFADIGIVDEDLNALVRSALIENGFTQKNPDLTISMASDFIYKPEDLPSRNIQMLGDLLLQWLPKIPGQKHTFCLALSGFLFNKQVSLESITELGYYVTKRSGTLFDDNLAFVNTLQHDTKASDKSRLKTGLPTMEEILEPFYPRQVVGKQLHLLTNPQIHKFWPNGRYAQQYKEVIIDYINHDMIINTIRTKVTKEGEISQNVVYSNKIFNNIDYLEYVDDLSNSKTLNDWEKPLRVVFTDVRGKTYEHIFDNSEDFILGYKKIQGSHGDHSKILAESILNEFEQLNFIKTIESCSRPGIWLSEKTQQLVKYVEEKGEIVKKETTRPQKQKVQKAIRLLKKINEVYPWKENKFGVFCKLCLTMPYTNVLKYNYNSQHPSVFLHGEAGTLKSTAAELAIYLNGDFSESLKNYIVSGGEMNSEYRFGKVMDISSFPVVVNEPEQLFLSSRTRELVKAAAFGKLIREPGGNHPKAYYSRRACIYTINALPNAAEDPSYLRRFISIGFDREERGDLPEVIEKMEFLNKNGNNNYRFRELTPIGDFVLYILNQNLRWFEDSLESLQDNIIQALELYTEEDLSFLKQPITQFIYTDRSEYESNTLTSILKVLKRPYMYSRGKFLQNADEITVVEEIIKTNPEYSYVHFVKSKDEDKKYILIDIGFKDAYNSYYIKEGKTITLQNVFNYLVDLDIDFDLLKLTPAYVEGRRKQIRGIKMSLLDFTKILVGKNNI